MVINCATGKTVDIDSLSFYKPNLKKHSVLMIEDLKKSLEKEGLCFPITVQKQNDKTYIVDGESRIQAMLELKQEGKEIPELPVVYVRGDLVRNIILSVSTSHFVHKQNLKEFAKNISLNLKEYSFYEGELMDFHTITDIDRYFQAIPEKKEDVDYVGLLAGDVI